MFEHSQRKKKVVVLRPSSATTNNLVCIIGHMKQTASNDPHLKSLLSKAFPTTINAGFMFFWNSFEVELSQVSCFLFWKGVSTAFNLGLWNPASLKILMRFVQSETKIRCTSKENHWIDFTDICRDRQAAVIYSEHFHSWHKHEKISQN